MLAIVYTAMFEHIDVFKRFATFGRKRRRLVVRRIHKGDGLTDLYRRTKRGLTANKTEDRGGEENKRKISPPRRKKSSVGLREIGPAKPRSALYHVLKPESCQPPIY